MSVAELIKILEQLDPNSEVRIQVEGPSQPITVVDFQPELDLYLIQSEPE